MSFLEDNCNNLKPPCHVLQGEFLLLQTTGCASYRRVIWFPANLPPTFPVNFSRKIILESSGFWNFGPNIPSKSTSISGWIHAWKVQLSSSWAQLQLPQLQIADCIDIGIGQKLYLFCRTSFNGYCRKIREKRYQMSVFLCCFVLITSTTAFNRVVTASYRGSWQLCTQSSVQDLERNLMNERMENFLSWANLAGIEAPKCEVFLFPGGLRGLRALEDIEDEEIFLKVPLRLCFSSQNIGLSRESNDASNYLKVQNQNSQGVLSIPSSITAQFDWPVRLALRIISESRCEGSLWAAYIGTLPQPPKDDDGEFCDSLSYSLPVHWDDVSYICCHFMEPSVVLVPQLVAQHVAQLVVSLVEPLVERSSVTYLLCNLFSYLFPDCVCKQFRHIYLILDYSFRRESFPRNLPNILYS